ncbi:glycosyltransferase family 2 protein [Salinicola sp. CR57]|uniref:glycosyltransferase family 2 protein n=1 Tax=Salinicola sp. CR57 TaxID=1949086 RepID=UPI000DA1F732|nr:glycosyltransferase family 2 protein [Salinicola sp. CR57]
MIKFLKHQKRWLSELLPIMFDAYRFGKAMRKKTDNAARISSNDVLLFVTMKNEVHRLEYFFKYYRELGVKHFFVVDNGSDDGTAEFLAKQEDVTSFYTEDSYKDSNFGMHWLNYLLFKYGRGHWCLTCDPDEFLVYPYMDTRSLQDLTSHLDSLDQDSFFTVMLDMYSSKPVSESHYAAGSDPLLTCPFYDSVGYSKQYNHSYRNLFVQGGVRRRVFAKDHPEAAPALNKVPLVKWAWNYVYVSSMHMMLPRRLNRCVDEKKTTGALLHFKFIGQLNDKVKHELLAKQHYNNSAEYKQYGAVIDKKELLYEEGVSVKYTGWKDIVRRGLANLGGW